MVNIYSTQLEFASWDKEFVLRQYVSEIEECVVLK